VFARDGTGEVGEGQAPDRKACGHGTLGAGGGEGLGQVGDEIVAEAPAERAGIEA
jgi:hypothetical protein